MIDDPDYQRHPYVFATLPGYRQDMSDGLRQAARAVLRSFVDQPTSYLEIGVWEGRSGCWMLDNVLTHPQSRYTGIDNWQGHAPNSFIPERARQHLAFHATKARLLEGDSLQIVPTMSETFDVIFVDGGHTFAACHADLVNVWPKLRIGGILIVDDYRYPGLEQVHEAVDHWHNDHLQDADVCFQSTAIAFKKHQ